MTDLENANVKRYSGLACGMRLDLSEPAPSVADLSLLLEAGDVTTRSGRPVDMPAMILKYDADLRLVLAHVQGTASLPPGFEFVVPDFWHVAHGDAKSFTQEDGQRLWKAGCLGVSIGRRLFPNMEIGEQRGNYRVTIYTGEPPFGVYPPKEKKE